MINGRHLKKGARHRETENKSHCDREGKTLGLLWYLNSLEAAEKGRIWAVLLQPHQIYHLRLFVKTLWKIGCVLTHRPSTQSTPMTIYYTSITPPCYHQPTNHRVPRALYINTDVESLPIVTDFKVIIHFHWCNLMYFILSFYTYIFSTLVGENACSLSYHFNHNNKKKTSPKNSLISNWYTPTRVNAMVNPLKPVSRVSTVTAKERRCEG